MNRQVALEQLRDLAHGLNADLAGAHRLLERIARSDESEELRSALTEVGALALLDGGMPR